MSQVSRRFWAYRLFQSWELFIFVAAFVAGIMALDRQGLWDTSQLTLWGQILLLAVLSAMWCFLINFFDLYSSRRLVTRANEVLGVVAVVLMAAGSLAVFGALLNFPTNNPVFLSWFLPVATVLMLGGRLAGRAILVAARTHGRNLRFVAVVGAAREGQELARKLTEKPSNGFVVVGLFDEQPVLDTLDGEFPDRGTFADLKQHLMKEPVDEVVITLPMETHYETIRKIMRQCERIGISVRVVNEFVSHAFSDVEVERIGDVATLHFCSEKDWGWQGKVKVALDWMLATLALIGLSPLLLIVAVLIKLDSPGPALFVQTRVGKNKKHFNFYKFRTMVVDAEARQASLEAQNEADGPVFKMRADPRITRLGAFLRKYSIDELPQLINVVKGDMSLVGPRPLPLRDVQRFDQEWYSRRFSVRPGLTCSWALAGRSELEFDEWVQLDLDYIDHWSLGKDLSICLGTIPRILRGSGAY